MEFIIVTYNTPEDSSIVLGEDGENMIFKTKQEAIKFAKEEIAFNWKVIEL